MLVDERLPKDKHIQEVSQNKHSQVPNTNTIVWRSLASMPPDELAATIRTQISEFTGWPSRELNDQGRIYEIHKGLCGERTFEEFLNSNAYQGWKNRKTRGPSLLHVSGSGTLCSDNHCCKSLGLTFSISRNW